MTRATRVRVQTLDQPDEPIESIESIESIGLPRAARGRLAVDAVHFVLTCVVLALAWRQLALCTALLAGIALGRFLLHRSMNDLLVFAFGFVFASVAEIVQVACGLYRYAQPSPLVIPAYNFFLWGAVLCLASSLCDAIEARLSRPLVVVSLRHLLLEAAGYVAITTLLCLAGQRSLLVAAVFAGVLFARLVFAHRAGDGWFVVLGMAFGPAVESWLVGLGIYRFADPALGNLPLWHPIYWGLITLFLRRAAAFRRQLVGTASASRDRR